MANIKKSDSDSKPIVIDTSAENTESTTTVEVVVQPDEKDEILKAQSAMIDGLKQQLLDMKSFIDSVQSKPTIVNTMPVYNNPENETLFVGCRFINGVAIYSPQRDVEVTIPFGESNRVELSVSEMRMCLKTPQVKEMLKKDVIYFEDESNYERFKISNRLNISDENLIDLISINDVPSILNEFNVFTSNKRDDNVVHSIVWRIVKLVMDGSLPKMQYNTRKAIEDYFKLSIDNGQMILSKFETIKAM
jgi:hypothetical protein